MCAVIVRSERSRPETHPPAVFGFFRNGCTWAPVRLKAKMLKANGKKTRNCRWWNLIIITGITTTFQLDLRPHKNKRQGCFVHLIEKEEKDSTFFLMAFLTFHVNMGNFQVQQQQQQLDFAGSVAIRTFVKRGVPANDTPSGRSNITSTTGSSCQFRVTLFSFRKKNFKKEEKIILFWVFKKRFHSLYPAPPPCKNRTK